MIAFQSFRSATGLQRVDVDVEVVDTFSAIVRSEISLLPNALFQEDKLTFDQIEADPDPGNGQDWIRSFRNIQGIKYCLSRTSEKS